MTRLVLLALLVAACGRMPTEADRAKRCTTYVTTQPVFDAYGNTVTTVTMTTKVCR